MTYTYEDTFILNSIEEEEHLRVETKALLDLEKQGITDTFYLENMCKCLVYIELGGLQLEAEGMEDKVKHYRSEYLRYSKMNNNDSEDNTIFSVSMGRA